MPYSVAVGSLVIPAYIVEPLLLFVLGKIDLGILGNVPSLVEIPLEKEHGDEYYPRVDFA